MVTYPGGMSQVERGRAFQNWHARGERGEWGLCHASTALDGQSGSTHGRPWPDPWGRGDRDEQLGLFRSGYPGGYPIHSAAGVIDPGVFSRRALYIYYPRNGFFRSCPMGYPQVIHSPWKRFHAHAVGRVTARFVLGISVGYPL